MFWLSAAGLAVFSLLFVVPPLLRRATQARMQRVELNARVVKDQLEELKADLAAGKLDESDYQAARQDLERDLLDTVEPQAQPGVQPVAGRSGRWLSVLLVLAIPAAAFLLYNELGSRDIIERLAEGGGTPAPAASAGAAPSMEAVIAELAARMEEHPEKLEGWLLLARSYASINRFGQAVEAYERARALAPDDPDVLSNYADALVMANGGRFDEKAGDLLNQAVAADPSHIKAHWLRGHWRFQQGDYARAIEDWRQTAAGLPPDNENIAIIEQQIQTAQARLGIAGTEPAIETSGAAPKPAAQAVSAGIKVSVTLDAALAARINPDDTLFIFARPAQGARMPLAIVRKRAGDLPLTVTLDDSMAMTPAMVLSKFPEVTVGARISSSGQAMPASGDLQGTVTPVATAGNQSVQLLIDQVVP